MAKGDELKVEDAFVRYLEDDGWTVRRHTGADYLDVRAERRGEVLCAEVKGHTGVNTNLDLDTMFGQILRRMTSRDHIYAVVVPSEAVGGVKRVEKWVRDALRIVVYEVDLSTCRVTRRED